MVVVGRQLGLEIRDQFLALSQSCFERLDAGRKRRIDALPLGFDLPDLRPQRRDPPFAILFFDRQTAFVAFTAEVIQQHAHQSAHDQEHAPHRVRLTDQP